MYWKYRPRAQKHNRPVSTENSPNIPHGSSRSERSRIPRPTLVEFVRRLPANHEEDLPDDNRRGAEEQRGADVGEKDVEDGEAGLPAKDPPKHRDGEDEVGTAAVPVEQRDVVVRHLGGVRSADGQVGAEGYEVSTVGPADAGRGEEAVVVADGYAVPAQGTVVGARRHRHPTVDAVSPVTARQRAVA